MDDNLIKVAYGIGCLETLREAKVSPEEFIKAAAQSNDAHAKNAADAICAVMHFAQTEAETTEKIASVILTPMSHRAKTALFDDDPEYGRRAAQGAAIGGALGGVGLGTAGGLIGAGPKGLGALSALGSGDFHLENPNFRLRGGDLRRMIARTLVESLLPGAIGAGLGAGAGALGGLATEGISQL